MIVEKRKKIVFLEAVIDYGGARISTVELAERLATKHEVIIIDFYGSNVSFVSEVKNRNIKLEILDQRDSPYIINSSKSIFIKLSNYLLYIPHWLRLRRGVINEISAINPDYIILNNFKVLSSLLFFPKKKFQTLFFARGWFIPKQIGQIENLFLKKCVDKYLCVSQATKQALYAGGLASLENLYVVPNAIDEFKLSKEKAYVKKGPRTTVILQSAGFLRDKGQLVALGMAKELKERNVDFKLLIVGIIYKDPESIIFYNEIIQLISEFHLEDHVELVVNKSNVIDYFNATDILIHPSETEGLPRVIMEAMILRKPVIANAVGGVTDYVLNGYTGFLPHHNSYLEYANAVECLIKDQAIYKEIAENAYNLVSKTYTKENQLNSLSKVFESQTIQKR